MLNKSKIAFCPACCGDFFESRKILSSFVDEIIYCDIEEHPNWNRIDNKDRSPKVSLVIEDAKTYVHKLPKIDVIFYRNDGKGEGGSGLNVNGPWGADNIATKFGNEGGLIITDGSNDEGHIYKKMFRPEGYTRNKTGLHFQLADDQHLLNEYGLHIIEVTA